MQKRLHSMLLLASLPFFLSVLLLCPLTNAQAQAPVNDSPENAIKLRGCVNGTTVGAVEEYPVRTCSGVADDDVWYEFTASSITHAVTVEGSGNFDAVVQVYEFLFGSESPIACVNATGNGGTETAVVSGLRIGGIYLVRVHSFDLAEGIFTICLTTPAPSNNDCENAITLVSGGDCVPTYGTTANATSSLGAITCGNHTGYADDDVWYKFTAVTGTHTVTVTEMEDFDAVIDVRSGTCNGISIACADATSSDTETATLSGLTIGSTYYIRVYSYDGNPFFDNAEYQGTFSICVTHSNDDCTGAYTLLSGTSCTPTNGTTVGATHSLAAITCGAFTGSADDDVWYKFTAIAANHTVTVAGQGSFNAVVDVRSGACNGISIACADATSATGTETVNLSGLTVGTTYFVRVYGWGSTPADRGTFTICIQNAPLNNECANAGTLTSTASCTATNGTTMNATQSLAAITCGTTTGNADDDVWYKFTAAFPLHTITVAGEGNFNAVIDVRSGNCNGTTIACADATVSGTETVNLSGLTVGTTYYVRVYSRGSTPADRGNFTICVTHTNDECVNVFTLIPATTYTTTAGTTTGATQSLTAITCGATTGSADDDVWYKFTAVATNHFVTVVGEGSFNAVVDVRSATCNGTTIACADATASGKETVNLSGLSIGSTYYVRVYSWGDNPADRGTFTISVTYSSDECANAGTLIPAAACTSIAGTTMNATQSLAAITCGTTTGSADDDVWYKFTAVATTHFVIVAGQGNFNAVVDVRSETCNGPHIACADAGENGGTEYAVLSGLTVGTTYYVRVYSRGSTPADRGNFTICILTFSYPAAENECSSLLITTLISGTSCTPTNGTTVGATQSLAAITCGATTGSADDDVWSRFTAVATTHTVKVAGQGNFNAVVDVRSATCNGTTIACADATASGTETVNLSGLSIGSTYYVRVYSRGSAPADQGTFTICVTHPCPANLTVTESITSERVVKEAVKVTATNQVSGGIVTYKATQAVTLQPGFRANVGAGSLFQAIIGGCP